jgi:hypothetical protein
VPKLELRAVTSLLSGSGVPETIALDAGSLIIVETYQQKQRGTIAIPDSCTYREIPTGNAFGYSQPESS